MKKLLIFLCAVTLVFGMMGKARALPFTLGSYDVTLHDSGPGLLVYENHILGTPITVNLEVGEMTGWVDLFEIGTDESYAGFDDWLNKEITVAFDFTDPTATAIATGETDGHLRLFRDDLGHVQWDNPTLFSFGTTGLFSIQLSEEYFGTPGSAIVQANMTYLEADTAPIPEPATLMLMGIGLAGLAGGAARRKWKENKVVDNG
jgi:hypothetical protein